MPAPAVFDALIGLDKHVEEYGIGDSRKAFRDDEEVWHSLVVSRVVDEIVFVGIHGLVNGHELRRERRRGSAGKRTGARLIAPERSKFRNHIAIVWCRDQPDDFDLELVRGIST